MTKGYNQPVWEYWEAPPAGYPDDEDRNQLPPCSGTKRCLCFSVFESTYDVPVAYCEKPLNVTNGVVEKVLDKDIPGQAVALVCDYGHEYTDPTSVAANCSADTEASSTVCDPCGLPDVAGVAAGRHLSDGPQRDLRDLRLGRGRLGLRRAHAGHVLE